MYEHFCFFVSHFFLSWSPSVSPHWLWHCLSTFSSFYNIRSSLSYSAMSIVCMSNPSNIRNIVSIKKLSLSRAEINLLRIGQDPWEGKQKRPQINTIAATRSTQLINVRGQKCTTSGRLPLTRASHGPLWLNADVLLSDALGEQKKKICTRSNKLHSVLFIKRSSELKIAAMMSFFAGYDLTDMI